MQLSPLITVVLGPSLTSLAYLVGIHQARRRGRGWPLGRSLAFAAGIIGLAVALIAGELLEARGVWVHVAQHTLLMAIAPMLLARSAPVSLILRAISPAHGRALVRALHSRPVRMTCGRTVPLLAAEYYGVMFLLYFTPWFAALEDHPILHAATHSYLVICGLMFWSAVAGRDPLPWRPSLRERRQLVWLGAPASLALGVMLMTRTDSLGGLDSVRQTHQLGLWIIVSGLAVCLLGDWWCRPSRSRRDRTRQLAQDKVQQTERAGLVQR
jgi:putative membrane protein